MSQIGEKLFAVEAPKANSLAIHIGISYAAFSN